MARITIDQAERAAFTRILTQLAPALDAFIARYAGRLGTTQREFLRMYLPDRLRTLMELAVICPALADRADEQCQERSDDSRERLIAGIQEAWHEAYFLAPGGRYFAELMGSFDPRARDDLYDLERLAETMLANHLQADVAGVAHAGRPVTISL